MNRIIFTLLALLSAPIHAEYVSRVVAEGLAFPWSMTFIDDDTFIVATRSGTLEQIRLSTSEQLTLSGTPETYVESQGGYFDLILDPDFTNNRRLYLALAEGPAEANATAIYQAVLGQTGLTAVTKIFRGTPNKDTPAHYGGKLAFLADATLLLTTGDGFEYREAAQDPFSQLGKILRLKTDGSAPENNPFADGKEGDPYVYSYGHRNPQGLAVSSSGQIWAHEHGPQGGDELNHIRPGNNYGWPATSFGINYSGARITPLTSAEGITPPVTYWLPSIAPSHLLIYQGALFEDWQGSFMVSALVDQDVKRLTLDDNSVTTSESLFGELGARIRGIHEGPDGAIYLLTDSDPGSVIEIRPKTVAPLTEPLTEPS
ncbi:MAG: PQQ-dependent sugar dehydrogenase [Pseudomonadales bacterium]|jgi:glucose/arabinose dehydrogenase|tara:strand:+ start:1639 stop:2757 length:1119 start_codon:yes stop_codon:yes gene_type:complete